MATWSDYGLPAFQTPGYRYSVDAGQLRTPFDTARPRQKRAYATNPHKYSVSVWVTQEQLTVAEWFLTNFGYSWFTADLTDEAGSAVPHFVRAITDYSVGVKGFNTYELRLDLEAYVEVQEIPQWVTSRIYPLYVFDAVVGGAPIAAKSIMEMYDTEGAFNSSALMGYAPTAPVSVTEMYDTEGAATGEAMRGGSPDVPAVTLTHI